MQVKKRKIISVTPENRDLLIEKFGCSQTTVYQALAYKTNNKRAANIREAALNEYGGVPQTIKQPI